MVNVVTKPPPPPKSFKLTRGLPLVWRVRLLWQNRDLHIALATQQRKRDVVMSTQEEQEAAAKAEEEEGAAPCCFLNI